MGLGSIIQIKELPQTFQPLLLCEFTLVDGSVYRACTHSLGGPYGGFQFGGFNWEPRILNQNIAALQAMSEIGVDIPPQASIMLADPDRTLHTTQEIPIGFKGAKLKIYATMYDAGNTIAGNFTTDNPWIVKFIGTCHAPDWDQGVLTVSSTSLLNMTQSIVPPLRVQQLCGWVFPPDAASRATAISDSSSVFSQCGYSPDQGGIGNFSTGTACFNFCNYTRGNCTQRMGNNNPVGQLDTDLSGRPTGRFGGFTWAPALSSGLQRPYTTGKWEEIINASTATKYGDFVPLVYGKTWVQPLCLGIRGDGNYTTMEVLVCYGQVESIDSVVVNGYTIPLLSGSYANPIASTATTNTFVNGFWVPVNNGNPTGHSNGLPGWGNQGDPYGSHTILYIQVLSQVASPNSIPDMQILLTGGKVRVYVNAAPTTSFPLGQYSLQFTSNPAWILMDLLTKVGWRYQDFDVGQWITAAAICDEQINFYSMSGTYQNYYNEVGFPPATRYSVGFAVRQRTPIGELVRGLRNAMKGVLYFDFATGKLTLLSKQTMASQQPSPIQGSNDLAPIASTTAQGVSANGYLAYHFNSSNIIKENGRSTLQVFQLKNTESPNKISTTFQNRENSYSQDSSTIIDTEDTTRMGGYPIGGTFPVTGPQTFDHIQRVANGYFAECFRGNLRTSYLGSQSGDTGGTMCFRFKTTVKGIHLMSGQICAITDDQSRGRIIRFPIRIVRIQPQANFEVAEFVGMAHNDVWYMDGFGQAGAPAFGNNTMAGYRTPYAWEAGVRLANPNDAYYSPGKTFFDVIPSYKFQVDDQPYAFVGVSGVPPVNSFDPKLQRPVIAPIGQGAPGTAAWSPDTYYFALAQLNQTTGIVTTSPLSVHGVANLTGAVDIQGILRSWPSTGSSGALACVGTDPLDMYWADGSPYSEQPGIPSLVVPFDIPGFGTLLRFPPPDELFNNFRFRVQQVLWPGICSASITAISFSPGGGGDTNLSVALSGSISSNAWVGRELLFAGVAPENLVTQSLLSTATPVIPVANLRITGNDSAGTMTVTGNPVDNGMPFRIKDVVVVRFLPTFGLDGVGPYFEDLAIINPRTLGLGFPINGLIGAQVMVIAGTGMGTSTTILSNTATRVYVKGWPIQPDSTTRVIILRPDFVVDQQSSPVLNRILNFKDVATLPIYELNVTTLQHKALMVQAFTESIGGVLSPQALTPFRELYLLDGSIEVVLVNGAGGPGVLG